MDASESDHRLSCPNKLPPAELEGIFTEMLTENVQLSARDLLHVQGMLNGYLTEEQAAHLKASRTALELGPRQVFIEAGISPLLVLDEVIGRRLALQLDRMGYRGRRLVIYEASGGRHELSIREAISLLPLCRELDIPSTVTLTGIEVAPGTMQQSLSTFPIIELHCFPSMGQSPPPIEAINPTIDTGKYVQVQALSVTKASEISRSAGSVVASGHGGVRSRKYDGLTVDVSLPGVILRRGCSCSEEEARAWARDRPLPSPAMDTADADADGVVFLCRVVDDRKGR
ncbi:unnamed protein product, partial [Ectocarpus sp. 8 AP-2014]